MKFGEQKKPTRTPKWCKRCGRKHNRFDDCGLVESKRLARSGRKVTRLIHPVKES